MRSFIFSRRYVALTCYLGVEGRISTAATASSSATPPSASPTSPAARVRQVLLLESAYRRRLLPLRRRLGPFSRLRRGHGATRPRQPRRRSRFAARLSSPLYENSGNGRPSPIACGRPSTSIRVESRGMPKAWRIVACRSPGPQATIGRLGGLAVGAAVHLTAANAAAGEGHRVAERIMIAACPRHARRAAELGQPHNQRRLQQAAIGQVVEQGGRALIQRRQQRVLQTREVVAVRVPVVAGCRR